MTDRTDLVSRLRDRLLNAERGFVDISVELLGAAIQAIEGASQADAEDGLFSGLTLEEVKRNLATLDADDLRGLCVSLVIQRRIWEKYASPAPAVSAGPPYPEGNVVGPCVCGSWPGGNCLKCEWRSAAPPSEPDMRAVCEALGFDPTNHHNAAKCPYCRPNDKNQREKQSKETSSCDPSATPSATR